MTHVTVKYTFFKINLSVTDYETNDIVIGHNTFFKRSIFYVHVFYESSFACTTSKRLQNSQVCIHRHSSKIGFTERKYIVRKFGF